MSTVPAVIADAYSPERLAKDGHRLIDAIAEQLASWQRREGVVLPWRAPSEARVQWPLQNGGADLVDDLRRVMRSSTALYHPRVMAHQVPPPLPGAALAELVSALMNNGMAVYEMGPASVPIELEVVDWMCRKLGYSAGAGGVLTSGGSLGNLTALLAMRQAKAGFDVWKQGAHGGPPLAVIVSSDAHYSVARTLRIMGWGDGGAISAQVDAAHRLTAASVEAALANAKRDGGRRRVIGIVAAAGSTATGAFDPLHELADVAEREGLWLHVDAAHGGGAALSSSLRGKLAGIERADSIVWDAHKLMMMPALVTAVLFKRGGHAYEAFAQQASYLFQAAAPEETWWDLGTRTLECTKRMMSIEVWTALRVHGEQLFGAIVDRLCTLTNVFAERVRATDDFEIALEPELNILCYRHKTADNRALRQRVVEDGRFYVVGTQLRAGYYLRSTIMNPLIEPSDFDELLAHLRSLCP
ncbi:MAG TPA: pyridoxal-dependent decarboxylase [Kofleriaceae bacterium]|nr:pyridoxal-dependent decarboxylase [Kofleriaceae bacterium]